MNAFAPRRIALLRLLLPACMLFASGAGAAPFELAVMPSRFELAGKPGARVGQSLQLQNVGDAATELAVRSIDWRFSEAGEITYHDELLPGSCREWVTIERRTLAVGARETRNFRFQVDIPADAPRGECRFMLAVEGVEPAQQALIEGGGASLSLPVTGRIAIAVYLAVGGAEPALRVTTIGTATINGKPTPAITVANDGDAHGRLDGSVDAEDANGLAFELVPETTPILPGQTRVIALSPRSDDGIAPPAIVFPLTAKGVLDWNRGGFRVDAEFR